MKKLKGYVEEAYSKAGTEGIYARRVEIFNKGVWQYMWRGYEQYMSKKASPIPSFKVPKVSKAGGDGSKVDWAKAVPLGENWFIRGSTNTTTRKLIGHVAHDGEWLYLRLIDKCDVSLLCVSPRVFAYDDWEIFLAKQRAVPYRQYAFGPTGLIVGLSYGEVNFRNNVPIEGLNDMMRVVSDTKSSTNEWAGYVALKLDKCVYEGAKAGDRLCLNITRVSNPALTLKAEKSGTFGIYSLVSYCSVHDVDRLAEIELEK
jgi:hypothetical protein